MYGAGIAAAGCSRSGVGIDVFKKLLRYNKSIWIGEMDRRAGSVLCDSPSEQICLNTPALEAQAQCVVTPQKA